MAGVCDETDGACRRPAGGRPPLPELDSGDWEVRRGRALRRKAAARAMDRAVVRRCTALLLDMGGVVIPTLFESVAVGGFPSGPLERESEYARVERGEVSERDYWAELARGRPDLDIGDLWRRCSIVRAEFARSLGAIARCVKVAAFTNDMTHWFGPAWPQRFPELRVFDSILEATELGVQKPDPEAFRRAASVLGERPERCLFVDDLECNLDGAAVAGMHTRLFDIRHPGDSVDAMLADLGITATAGRSGPVRAFYGPRSDDVRTATQHTAVGQLGGARGMQRRAFHAGGGAAAGIAPAPLAAR